MTNDGVLMCIRTEVVDVYCRIMYSSIWMHAIAFMRKWIWYNVERERINEEKITIKKKRNNKARNGFGDEKTMHNCYACHNTRWMCTLCSGSRRIQNLISHQIACMPSNHFKFTCCSSVFHLQYISHTERHDNITNNRFSLIKKYKSWFLPYFSSIVVLLPIKPLIWLILIYALFILFYWWIIVSICNWTNTNTILFVCRLDQTPKKRCLNSKIRHNTHRLQWVKHCWEIKVRL